MQSAFSLAERPVAEVLARIRRGLPASMFDQIAATLGLSTSVLAAKLGIARRTLIRKHGTGAPLSSEASEKVLRIARICNLARALSQGGVQRTRGSAGFRPLAYGGASGGLCGTISLPRRSRDSGSPQADHGSSAVPLFRGRDPG